MPTTEWARLRADETAQLRRGAWYRVVRLTPLEAVVDVNGRPVAVPRPALQIVPTPPTRWSVVARPAHAPRMPLAWGARYGVCPNCRERAHLEPKATSMRCPRCNGFFDIGWEES
ncbi:MAG: hypothetical protein ACREMN_11425 [Gemmatimonadales bacterium]